MPTRHEFKKHERTESGRKDKQRERAERFTAQDERRESRFAEERESRHKSRDASDADMETYRVAVGHEHQVKPGNIVGAIANEAGIDSKYIGRIQIFDNYSLVDLPGGMPKEVLKHLKKVWVAGQELRITLQKPGRHSHADHDGGEEQVEAEPEASSRRSFRDRGDGERSGGGRGAPRDASGNRGPRAHRGSSAERPSRGGGRNPKPHRKGKPR